MPSMEDEPEIKFVTACREKHYDLLSEIFIKEFSQQAPLTRASEAKPEEIEQAYREFFEKSINSPHSILVFQNEKVIGWAFNFIISDIETTNDDPNLTFKKDYGEEIASKGYGNLRANRIVTVVEEIEKNFAYFMPGSKKIFKLDILYVDPNHGGKGLATILTKKAFELAHKSECDFFMSVATNNKSEHIFKKFGLKVVREIPFNAFLENGQTFLKDFGDGNKSIRLMVMKL